MCYRHFHLSSGSISPCCRSHQLWNHRTMLYSPYTCCHHSDRQRRPPARLRSGNGLCCSGNRRCEYARCRSARSPPCWSRCRARRFGPRTCCHCSDRHNRPPGGRVQSSYTVAVIVGRAGVPSICRADDRYVIRGGGEELAAEDDERARQCTTSDRSTKGQ